ncbi:hypothetical protein KORDIASMS9_03651 [Kordia sp. SMS9]|uniref:hypothetical protein n=1 Tax=Kordia sp. SMS9 TaxID=2282170 RepID=UPI000E101A99|nr:hypothetical protein [Kordia sp. SMS9]AXG71394.1 hypothetical protein KORDIASMS9_03651 [Kordia sp. SMS9]
MKKKLCIVLALISSSILFAQADNTFPYPNSGDVGIGTGTDQNNVNFNFQVHGITDYIIRLQEAQQAVTKSGSTKASGALNAGKTARIGITNSETGATENDGAVLRMSKFDFYIVNQERKNLALTSGVVGLRLHGDHQRIWMGAQSYYTPSTSTELASTNIGTTSDNGLYVRTRSSSEEGYGVSVRVRKNEQNAIQVVSTDGDDVNFTVKPTGEVYARKYVTTLNPFPDYVFENDYKLLSFDELRTYIAHNKHLPNVPSAKVVAANGADLGEMNRVLVEKVEELTLYILQLEARLQKLEKQK